MITATQVSECLWTLVYENGVLVGELIIMEDGYFQFWPNEELSGYQTSWQLRLIADIMDELNEPWDKELAAYIEAHPW